MRAGTLIPALCLLAVGCASTGAVDEDGSLNGYNVKAGSESNFIDSMTSPVFEVDMSRSEIIAQAETCANRHLSVDAVITSGGSEPIFGESETETVQGGAVVQQASPEQGMLIAQGRTEYSHAMISHRAESTLIVEAKDGRFRITYENIKSLQQNTGYAQQDGFNRVRQQWGSGWENTLTALQEMGKQVVDCVQTPRDDDW